MAMHSSAEPVLAVEARVKAFPMGYPITQLDAKFLRTFVPIVKVTFPQN